MTGCRTGTCGGRRDPSHRPIEFFVQGDEGDSEPFDRYDDAQAYVDTYGGRVRVRAKS